MEWEKERPLITCGHIPSISISIEHWVIIVDPTCHVVVSIGKVGINWNAIQTLHALWAWRYKEYCHRRYKLRALTWPLSTCNWAILELHTICDRICEKGPYPAIIKFALRSFL